MVYPRKLTSVVKLFIQFPETYLVGCLAGSLVVWFVWLVGWLAWLVWLVGCSMEVGDLSTSGRLSNSLLSHNNFVVRPTLEEFQELKY